MARPPVSAKILVGIVLLCLILSALAIPLLLKLPAWLEVEAVIVSWFLVWWTVLAALLFRGWTIADDYDPRVKSTDRDESLTDWILALDFTEGLAGFVVSVILAVVFGFLSYLLVELALPSVALLAYSIVLKMLRSAAHDRHGCEGNFVYAILYGGLWAGLYTLPLMLLVGLVHLLILRA
jgi:hypothetical protein